MGAVVVPASLEEQPMRQPRTSAQAETRKEKRMV
jgi:hypothetical protein